VHAPDQRLYVSSLSAGAIYRVGPAGEVGGQPPAASTAPGTEAPGQTVDVTVGTDTGAELRFEPAEVTVRAGAEVRLTFANQSTIPHNLTFQGDITAATATVVPAGASETITFTAPAPGQYQFVCTLHPGMSGTLIVDDA
jgi:plastocyanin